MRNFGPKYYLSVRFSIAKKKCAALKIIMIDLFFILIKINSRFVVIVTFISCF